MSMPDTILNVCSGVRLDPRYEHSIYFDSLADQERYFAGKVVHTFPALSYLRKSWPVQVHATIEEARNWSYLFFQNDTGKTYYYFITKVEYKNEAMVDLTLELDVIQTYLFTIKRGLLPCFVERQHTETDKIGEHTLDEGLEIGELMDLSTFDWDSLKEMCILVLATINPNYTETDKPVDALGYLYNGVFSGLTVWAVPVSRWQDLSTSLETLTEKGFIDGILSMWMYPKSLVSLGGESEWTDEELYKVVTTFDTTKTDYLTREYETYRNDIQEFSNRKLYCYPYNFLYATNNQGQSATYRFERFKDPDAITFACYGTMSPEAGVKMNPCNYNGLEGDGTLVHNYDQGLSMGGYPTCAWDSDVYKLWLAQNQNQNQHAMNTAGLTMAGGALTAVGSLLSGNLIGVAGGAGAVIGGLNQISGLMAQKADMAIQPPQSRGSFSSTVNVSAGKQTFTFIHKGVTPEVAKTLDGFFTMYGYKLNEVRTPNLNARPAFTYIKTVGFHMEGWFCAEDQNKIASIFDHGITFWKNGDKIGDYSQNNKVN